jgi:FdhE protein
MASATDTRWEARIARARHLASIRPEASDALAFFADLATLLQSIAAGHHSSRSAMPEYLRWLQRNAPGPIAEAATRYDGAGGDAASAFIGEALLHVFPPDPCPDCEGPPVVSLLRDAAHGSRRSHVCGTCLRESAAMRLGCDACGESDVQKMSVYRTDATDPARIDACDSCRTYLKTIDLTKDATACPIADDLASVTLDLWAREQGYRRGRPNLLRL